MKSLKHYHSNCIIATLAARTTVPDDQPPPVDEPRMSVVEFLAFGVRGRTSVCLQ